MTLTIEKAKKLMRLKLVTQPNVINHIEKVAEKAVKLGKIMKNKGYDIDLESLETAAYLHDIGRSVTHGIGHAIEGVKIIRNYGFSEPVLRMVERHIGAGITAEEASKLGLPKKDYIPETLEEKLLSYSDKFLDRKFVFKTIDGEQIVERINNESGSIDPTLKRFREKFGPRSLIVLRLENLRDEMEELLK